MRLYTEDIVRLRPGVGQPGDLSAVVHRVWHDEFEQYPIDPTKPDKETDLDRGLKEGEYGIRVYPDGRPVILQGDGLEVVDRAFQVGDICKLDSFSPDFDGASGLQHLSGVVVDVKAELSLYHVITGEHIAQMVPTADVQHAASLMIGDHVVFGDWLGVVDELFEAGMIASDYCDKLQRMGDIVRPEHPMRFGPLSQPAENEQSPDIDRYRPPFARPEYNPIVVDVQQIVAGVTWLALNGNLSPEQQACRPMPARVWSDIDRLTLVRQFIDHKYTLDDPLLFRTPELETEFGLNPTYHGPDRLACKVMRVSGMRSSVCVLWQNGERSEVRSTSLVPHIDLDEHEVWPGDHVLFRDIDDNVDRGAVVQSTDPVQRTATMVLYKKGEARVDEGSECVVSILDLKTAGSPDYPQGLHRGEVVLVSAIASSYLPPAIGRVGGASLVDELATEQLRVDVARAGSHRMSAIARDSLPVSKEPKPASQATDVDWYGVVTDMPLDGTVMVQFPSGRCQALTMDKLMLLDDGFDDTSSSTRSDEYDDEYDEEMSEANVPWITEEGGEADAEEWEDDVDDVDEIVVNSEPVKDLDEDEKDASAVEDATKSATTTTTNGTSAVPVKHEKLSTFEILEEAPQDHAFVSSPVVAMQKTFITRLQREYKMLRSSLPDTILVRTYEDRADLLRALIIGTQGTPYEDAPILIDFQLKPSYPHEPPLTFFHSWSDGHGRLSPNLYEEGRICLSILGTWSGEQSEAWNPAKSTLLQVLVSIQGLVLVAEPYYTEPGFEKQANSEQGTRNSRHYSERAYVLARRFVLHAMRTPIAGLERELEVMYRMRGRLRDVVDKAAFLCDRPDAKALPAESWSMGEPMTKGGQLSLDRILTELERQL